MAGTVTSARSNDPLPEAIGLPGLITDDDSADEAEIGLMLRADQPIVAGGWSDCWAKTTRWRK